MAAFQNSQVHREISAVSSKEAAFHFSDKRDVFLPVRTAVQEGADTGQSSQNQAEKEEIFNLLRTFAKSELRTECGCDGVGGQWQLLTPR